MDFGYQFLEIGGFLPVSLGYTHPLVLEIKTLPFFHCLTLYSGVQILLVDGVAFGTLILCSSGCQVYSFRGHHVDTVRLDCGHLPCAPGSIFDISFRSLCIQFSV